MASANLPIYKPHLQLPRFRALQELSVEAAKELEDYLTELNHTWEERDRQLARVAHISSQAVNVMEYAGGAPMNDGITDATEMFVRAVADTQQTFFYIPDGTYVLPTGFTISRASRWVLGPAAVLKPGAAINVTANLVEIEGSGKGSRILGTSGSANIIVVDGASTIRFFQLANLQIALNSGTGTAGAAIRLVDVHNSRLYDLRISNVGLFGNVWNGLYAEDVYQMNIEDVIVTDTAEDGIILVDTLDIRMRGVQVIEAAGNGFVLDTCSGIETSSCQSFGSGIDGVVIKQTVGVPTFDGSFFHSHVSFVSDTSTGHHWNITNLGSSRFTACWAQSGTGTNTDGFHIEGTTLGVDGGRNLTFQGCTVSSNRRHGFYILKGTQIRIGGSHIKQNDKQGTGGGAAGVYVETSTDLIISNNDFRTFNSTQDYAVWLAGTVTNHVIVKSNNCREQVVAPFNDLASGTDIIFSDNLPTAIPSVTAATTTTIPRTDEFVTLIGNTVAVNILNMVPTVGVNPYVACVARLLVAPTGATGQTITINDNSVAAGNMRLANNQNFVVVAAVGGETGVLELVWNGTAWVELSRTVEIDNVGGFATTDGVVP